jgi:ubiquinone/menaquinone biosynthesis C-methylase UbiE
MAYTTEQGMARGGEERMGYFAWVYSRLAPAFERVMAPHRERMSLEAWGRTLVVGAGTGLDVPYLQRRDIAPDLLEPDPTLAAALRRRFPELRVLEAPAEHIPAADASYDTVMVTLVLCSVRDLGESLSEIQRVLKPGGRLLLTEHVGHETGLGRWLQHAVEPVWKPLAGGCHLTRTPANLRSHTTLQPQAWTSIRPGLLLPMVQGTWVKPPEHGKGAGGP